MRKLRFEEIKEIVKSRQGYTLWHLEELIVMVEEAQAALEKAQEALSKVEKSSTLFISDGPFDDDEGPPL
jgi:hypothetical protein